MPKLIEVDLEALADAHPGIKLMPGSASGLSYFAFARKGAFTLGVKPTAVFATGLLSNTTGFGVRLRGAVTDLFEENPEPWLQLAMEAAWPNILWENKSSSRLSSNVALYVKGSLHDDPETLMQSLKEKSIATELTDFLIGLVPEEDLVISKDDLLGLLTDFFTPVLETLKDKAVKEIARIEKKKQELSATAGVGVAGINAQLIKQQLEARKAAYATTHPKVEDLDENEEPDGDDEFFE